VSTHLGVVDFEQVLAQQPVDGFVERAGPRAGLQQRALERVGVAPREHRA
jgi:hypothetical protein